MTETNADDVIAAYKAKPPEWLPEIHRTSDLGYLGFHPSRPGQEEDQLSEKFVRDGFNSSSSVSAETFSALALAKEGLSDASLLSNIEDVIKRVFSRRADIHKSIPAPSFKLPGRSTVNDARRAAWVNDLANPGIPLQNLGRSVPSGFKGHDLLEMLQTNAVTISRAVWYIRILGGNETQGMRNRPGFNPTQYSVEWTNTMTSYLKKLLLDIALPSPPRPGLNLRQVFKNNFADPDAREKWVTRCSYHLDLLQACYSEALIDQFSFLSWLCGQIHDSATTIAQLPLICRIAHEYADGVAGYRPFSCAFLRGCFLRLIEIEASPFSKQIPSTTLSLERIILRFLILTPDSFVCAETWKEHSVQIQRLLHRLVASNVTSQVFDHATSDRVYELYNQIIDRNLALLLQDLPDRPRIERRTHVQGIKTLIGISLNRGVPRSSYFTSVEFFKCELDLLLSWAIAPSQSGDHRIFLAAGIILVWLRAEQSNQTAVNRLDFHRVELQESLFDWLETHLKHRDFDVLRIAQLFTELLRRELFSYPRYMQRLIARSDVLTLHQADQSPHADFLRYLPLMRTDASLTQQRKICLYGHRIRISPEDSTKDIVSRQLQAVLSYFFDGEAQESASLYPARKLTTGESDQGKKPAQREDWKTDLTVLFEATLYEQMAIVQDTLMPNIRRKLKRKEYIDGSAMRSYCILVDLMHSLKAYQTLSELVLLFLKHSAGQPLLNKAFEVIIRHSDVLDAMDVSSDIGYAISSNLPIWRSESYDLRPLLHLVKRVDLKHHLSQKARNLLSEYQTSLVQTLCPLIINSTPAPLTIPAILFLARDQGKDAASGLAYSLWKQYRSSPNLGWILWDNVFASIRQIPTLFQGTDQRIACALRYSEFLSFVHERSPGDFDTQVAKWLTGSGKQEMRALADGIWDLFAVVLRDLYNRGILAFDTIVRGVLCPSWSFAATEELLSKERSELPGMLASCNVILRWIFLCSSTREDIGVKERQYLEAEAVSSLRSETLYQILAAIPEIVLLESCQGVDVELRSFITATRVQVSKSPILQNAVQMDLEASGQRFLLSLMKLSPEPSLKWRIAEAGKLIFLGERYTGDLLPGNPADGYEQSSWTFLHRATHIQLTLHQYNEVQEESMFPPDFDKFVDLFFETVSSEEGEAITEFVSGLAGSLKAKFIVSGVQRFLPMLTGDVEEPNRAIWAQEFISSCGGILRMLSKIVQPWSDPTIHPTPNPPPTLDDFVTVLASRMQLLLQQVCQDPEATEDDFWSKELMVFLARLVHFCLGFFAMLPDSSRQTLASLGSALCNTLLDSQVSDRLDSQLYVILLDTAAYILDAMPPGDRPVSDDSWRTALYDGKKLSTVAGDTNITRAIAMCYFIPSDFLLKDLVTVTSEAGHERNPAYRIQFKPWEWLDYSDIHDTSQESNSVQNVTSIPLENFQPLVTGDSILNPSHETDPIVAGELPAFQDDLSRSSVFERDWIYTRATNEMRGESDDLSTTRSRTISDRDLDNMSRGTNSRSFGSPAPSNASRSSVATSSGSWKPSPGPRPPSTGASFDEPPSAPSTGLKRKAEENTDDRSSKRPSSKPNSAPGRRK